MIVKDSNKSDWLYVIVSVGLSHVLTAVVLKTSLCFSVDCLILGFRLPTLLVGSVATTSCDWLLNFAPPTQPFTFEQKKQRLLFRVFPG